ncbi:TlpA disulfide reductase family protein [Pedobacter sp. L105]|uniref:TlpA family protein disulfide reductase n=1 Tax=Pedobacter sp. L105 TaxID=1641871 RepID=UPI00131D61D2|nr:TlpA disulfide reductase family protein [Pedobacter sp. L105]
MDTSLKKLPSAVILLKKIEISKQLKIGKVFTTISLKDTIGKAFKIGNFKDKYILIDFWASWCIPCRQESPELIKIFKKYKGEGFQIISISRDVISSKANWKKAIKQDHTNLWPQLSDFDNLAQNTYAIRFIPTNYLVDKNGVIIARDLKGKELEEELKKLFGR